MDDEKPRSWRPHKMAAAMPRQRCKGCTAVFQPVHVMQDFHAPSCRTQYWAKARYRGQTVYELLVAWRKYRGQGKGKGKMSDIAAIVDTWLAEDGIAIVSQKRKRKDT